MEEKRSPQTASLLPTQDQSIMYCSHLHNVSEHKVGGPTVKWTFFT